MTLIIGQGCSSSVLFQRESQNGDTVERQLSGILVIKPTAYLLLSPTRSLCVYASLSFSLSIFLAVLFLVLSLSLSAVGAGLLVHPGEDDFNDVLLLSAPRCTLLQAAEELGLCKHDLDGNMAAFSFHNKEHFRNSGDPLKH